MAQEILRKKGSLTVAEGQATLACPAWLPKATLVLLPIAACWQVWLWSFGRLTDRSDDPFGLFALFAATGFSLIATKQQPASTPVHRIDGTQLGLIAVSLAAYALSANSLPMLIRGGFAILAVALVVSRVVFGMRINLSILGLCLLSLPVVATMQFYMGYPSRVLVTQAVSTILTLAGYSVSQSGTDLMWGSRIIGIDPSCSGVRMLWTGFFAALVLACLHKMNNSRTILLGIAALTVVLFGNIIRATALFFIEVLTERSHFIAPEWLHSGIGMFAFAFILACLAGMASLIAGQPKQPTQSTGGQCPEDASVIPQRFALSPPLANGFLALLCLIVIATSWTNSTTKTPAISHSTSDSVLPLTVDGTAVRELPLSESEKSFTEAFPGVIHKMTDGRRQIIFRDVMQATRQLHPSEDCFKGSGYQTHSKPNMRDDHGTAWGQFSASKGDVSLIVRERIYDDHGQSWTDVSAWYWAALFGKTKAPWHAVTIASPV